MVAAKTCFKCSSVRPLDDFYRHPGMADGRLNKCKACTKADVRAHRRDNDSVREYDRERAKLPHRVAKQIRVTREWRAANPERRAAHIALGNAVRDGRVKQQPCWVCGERAEAHHPDYSAPLEVVWLCPMHHKRTHALVDEINREAA